MRKLTYQERLEAAAKDIAGIVDAQLATDEDVSLYAEVFGKAIGVDFHCSWSNARTQIEYAYDELS